ncbi:MAG: GNAT family N-acetyltransferase [Rhodovibrionaceae bacterium]
MPDGSEPAVLKVVSALAEVPAAEWDACAGADNPFVSHAFLLALEESGAATEQTGWLGQHLCLEDASGRLLGAVPLYLKNHSYGEYIFDWGWADAYERAGGRYYPKLQCAVPFTPVTGPRLLVRGGTDETAVRETLIAGLREIFTRHGVSSLHVTFATKTEWEAFGEAGFLQRLDLQYHWHNHGYASFDDFLGALASRKRKAIRKERRKVAESGIELRALSGKNLKEDHWDAFYAFYLATADKKWGRPYLTREFFSLLGERMAEQVVLILAEADGQPVAGALNLRDSQAIYGRNWGCLAEFKFLHFETCYYAAIDYAIEHGLQRVEAGAQGEHKIQRGYLPSETYSAHLIRDPGLEEAVADYLRREGQAIRHEIAALAEHSPFRQEEEK